jgi:hypothetical protein
LVPVYVTTDQQGLILKDSKFQNAFLCDPVFYVLRISNDAHVYSRNGGESSFNLVWYVINLLKSSGNFTYDQV